MLAPRASPGGGSSGSVFLLSRLLPHARHCFVSLPAGAFAAQLASRENNQGCMVLSLEWSDGAPNTSAPGASAAGGTAPAAPLRRIYVGWLGDVVPRDANGGHDGMGAIGLPALFAQSLGLTDGVRIHVQLVPDRVAASLSGGGGVGAMSSSSGSSSSLPGASKDLVCLEPLTTDEWEILELNAGAVEMGLLAQIQVLNPGQTFPLWIGAGGSARSNTPGAGGVCIRMKQTPAGGQGKDLLGGKSNAAAVAAAASVPFYKLTLNSEVSIVPKPRSSKRAAASSQQAAMPAGPPPPVAKLRVQPWQAGAIGREVARQRRQQREEARLERLRIQESKVREWEEHRGIDLARPLLPLESGTSPHSDAAASVCTLTSSHYVHVSSATMRHLQVEPHALVVLSFVRKVPAGKPVFPAPPSPPTTETMTSVVRIAESHCVFESATAAAGASFAATAPHHILLPPALRLALHVGDFVWVHVQKLTGASSLSATTPLAQRLRVQESTQRLQSIRLREIRVVPQTRDSSSRSSGASGSSKRASHSAQSDLLVPSQRAALLSPAAEEQDARNVSQAFLDYVRTACSDVTQPDVPLPLPMVNGALVALLVPSVSLGPGAHAPAHVLMQRRFFSVHFNEVELLKGAASASAAMGTEPDGVADSPTASAAASAGGGVKVSMATSYFLLRHSPSVAADSNALVVADGSAAKKKSKKKQAALVAPLPTPVINQLPQPVALELDGFEDGWDQVGAASPEIDADVDADAEPLSESDALAVAGLAPPAANAPLALEELGGGPEFHKTVVQPIWRFLANSLCSHFIQARADLVQRGEAQQGPSDALALVPSASAPAPSHVPAAASVSSLGGLMLVGASRGCGKSTLLRSICHKLRYPNRELSDLRSWLHRLLFKEVLSAAPGGVVIVLDDLDKFLPAPAGDNDGGASLRVTQQAEILYDALTSFYAQHPRVPLALLSICSSATSHHPLCNLLFPHVVTLPNPSAADRQDMLVKLVAALSRQATTTAAAAARASAGAVRSAPIVKLSRKVEVAAIARRTEGYTVSDLKQLVTRVLHAALTRTMQQQTAAPVTAIVPTSGALELRSTAASSNSAPAFLLMPADFDAAFRGFVPSALKELALNDPSGSDASSGASDASPTAGWESVGGLFSLKRTLLDTLELPTRYSMLFAAAPLKLRSGLLIYGPPGCGKTMIASHVAAKCGLNFLSVKGPELLNKYIGSSEQNVRDIFTRARNAAPALLFFDEMDSIVPRRGGDSTGVTDRVVNQFLCELDGVEGAISGGKQLYVLGASSRPDLIDPALLRPGRLDKALYCGLPNRDERADMLRRMTAGLALDDDVDLEWIAARTDEYTPADLQAIVTNAQMALVQEAIQAAQESIQTQRTNAASKRSQKASAPSAASSSALPPLTQAHLLDALSASKPSTSAAERARYDKIYQKFKLNRDEPIESADFDPTKPQRQALA